MHKTEFQIKDSGERLEYASGSLRDTDTGKLKWSRILFGPMAKRWAWHLTKAEAKYPDPQPGVPNFTLIETDEELARYRESALRHFMQWWEGDLDEDHAAAVFFNINGVEIIKEKQSTKRLQEQQKQREMQQYLLTQLAPAQGGSLPSPLEQRGMLQGPTTNNQYR